MFLPGRDSEKERQSKQTELKRVEELCLERIPPPLRGDVQISVQEVQCGDPQCAPIDTAVTLMFQSGGQGIFGLPMEANEVTKKELDHVFPPARILEAWHRGEEAEWPEPEPLRFSVGNKVFCRIGPSDWAPGTVAQLWYREPGWPDNSFAPYKIRLDDGRDIFAPADMDQIIKLNPNAPQPTADDV